MIGVNNLPIFLPYSPTNSIDQFLDLWGPPLTYVELICKMRLRKYGKNIDTNYFSILFVRSVKDLVKILC